MSRCENQSPKPLRPSWLAALLCLGCALLVAPAAQATEDDAASLFDLGAASPDPIFDLGEPLTPDPATGEFPWNEEIYATTFATSGRPRSGLGHILDGKNDLFVALPAVRDPLPCLDGRMMRKDKSAGTITCRVVEIRPHGKATPVVEATVEDIGPWQIADPYWSTGSRPDAEDGTDAKGRKTNRAGIDLSPALHKALGVPRSALVDWRFKTDEDGNIVTITRQETFRA